MKNKIKIILLALLLINPVFATNDGKEMTQLPETKEEKMEVRDQKIMVPTKHGVDRATLEEANKIAELEKKTTTELAKTFLIGDFETGSILEYNNIDEVVGMASTSKLVSIYVVFDEIKAGRLKMDDQITVSHEAQVLPGSSYKLKEGDTKTVKEMITAALVASGNDAVTSLGLKIAGTTENFVKMMNEKVKRLGLTNAHMVNPTGLTDYTTEDYNKMTTREMFILARNLIKDYPEVLEFTKTPSIIETERNFEEYSTNPILGIVEGVDGLKTGYTGAAGRCLIATELKRGDGKKTKDLRLITITTGSKSDWARYVVAKRVATLALDRYENRILGNTKEPLGQIEVENSQEGKYDVYQESEISSLLNKDANVEQEKEYNVAKAPFEKNTVVGTITYKVDGEEVGSSKLIIKEDVRERGIINKIMSIYREIFKNIDEKKAA